MLHRIWEAIKDACKTHPDWDSDSGQPLFIGSVIEHPELTAMIQASSMVTDGDNDAV